MLKGQNFLEVDLQLVAIDDHLAQRHRRFDNNGCMPLEFTPALMISLKSPKDLSAS